MKAYILVLTIALLVFSLPVSSAQKEVIAILDFQSVAAPEDYGIGVAEILRPELANLGGYTLVEKGVVKKAAEAQGVRMTKEAVDTSVAVKIGKSVGATLVVTGSVVKFGTTFTINAKLVDVNTGQVRATQNVRGDSEDELPAMVHQVAVILTGKTTATIPVITPGTQSSSPLSSGQTPRLEGMVYIPAGSFRMGSQDGDESEKPVHEVSVKAFFIDQYEVTNQQYQEFMRATGYAAPKYWNDSDYNKPDHPVVGVSWNDAVAYCQWVQKRLPTEEEWEKAARGKNGLQTSAQYPWGDTPPHAGGIFRANYDPGSFSEDGYAKTAPVKSFESGGALWDDGKVYNMVGNVREWTASWFMPYPNSQFKSSRLGQKYYVVRGGSWKDSASYTRVAARDGWSPQSKQPHLGFRCAKDA